MFVRGKANNKRNIVVYLCAVQAYQAVCGCLPVNIKGMVDSEDEVGSPNLPFVFSHLDLL